MALSSTTLANELAALTPTTSAATAAARMADAFDAYFQGASVSGVVPVAGSTAPARAALLAAMPGLSGPGAAAGQLAAGISAYWAALVPLIAVVWIVPGFTVVPGSLIVPGGLAGLAGAIQSAFGANQTANAPLVAAATTLAAAIHAANIGGTVTLQAIGGPPPPPIVIPIL